MTTTTKITVDGVELMIEQTIVKKAVYVSVRRVVGRDRERKIDITNGVKTEVEDALGLVRLLKQVAAIKTAPCRCDYRYGYSDHATHCHSLYVAREERAYEDD